MQRLVRQAAQALRDARHVDIYSHIDPDGITSGTIASVALERRGIDHDLHFLKKLDTPTAEAIRDANPEAVWFTDLGSGLYPLLADLPGVVTDHHVPAAGAVAGAPQRDLRAFATPELVHVNPHLVGVDGATEVSSAGCAYLVARALDPANRDLSGVAVVGAVGDQQDRAQGRLVGLNRELLRDGRAEGTVEVLVDLRLFGRETRPVFKLLQYANDPPLPLLTEAEEACIVFFLEQGIDLKEDGAWRRWIDLAEWERRRVVSELVTMLLEKGYGHRLARRLVGEVYLLAREEEGTPLHDAKEFATLLNACGRYDAAEVGYEICRGDRDAFYRRALELLKEHRGHIVTSLDVVQEVGVDRMESLQFFHGGDRIRDTVVGIAAGMVLGSGKANSGMPLFAFANADDGVKVSARAPRNLLARGLDLAAVMRKAAAEVGGEGGGHNVAAGATIPRGTEEAFLEVADRLVHRQLDGRDPLPEGD